MSLWIKKNWVIPAIVIIGLCLTAYLYGCEPTTQSLNDYNKKVTRQELQFELDQIIKLAEIRMVDLEKQERLRSIILQNALIIVQGQPINPVGILTAICAIYGVAQGGQNVRKVVKTVRAKRKENNA